MEVGTQILIERMQTHPEEFGEGKISKWARVWAYAMEYMPEEDKQALKEANHRLRVSHFNEMVLKELAGEQESEVVETVTYKAKERYAVGITDPRAMMYDHWTDSQRLTAIDEGLKSWKTGKTK